MVRPHPHLVPPVNLSLFPPGLRPNGGIVLLQPAANRFRVLFKGPTQWFLRRKPPIPQVAAHRPYRQKDAVALMNELNNGLPRPKVKGQLQLVRVTVGDGPNGLGRLPRLQRSPRRPPLTARLESAASSFPIRRDPSADRLPRHTEQCGNFNLCLPFLNCLDCLPAKVLLGDGRKGSCVFDLHAQNIA